MGKDISSCNEARVIMDRSGDYKESCVGTLHKYALHFWFCHRNQIILDTIKKKCKGQRGTHIIELGAGSGIISRFLKSYGYRVSASDMYASGVKYFEDEVDNAFVFDMISDDIPCQYRGKYEIIVLSDVIEHLKEPIAVLRKVREFLAEDGFIVVTVPALKQLWTAYDEWGGHKKRYDKRNLVQELTNSNYHVEEVKYFMFVPAILLFFQRKLRRSANSAEDSFRDELNISAFINKVMKIVMSVEYWVGKIIDYPFGSSLIAVGKK